MSTLLSRPLKADCSVQKSLTGDFIIFSFGKFLMSLHNSSSRVFAIFFVVSHRIIRVFNAFVVVYGVGITLTDFLIDFSSYL